MIVLILFTVTINVVTDTVLMFTASTLGVGRREERIHV